MKMLEINTLGVTDRKAPFGWIYSHSKTMILFIYCCTVTRHDNRTFIHSFTVKIRNHLLNNLELSNKNLQQTNQIIKSETHKKMKTKIELHLNCIRSAQVLSCSIFVFLLHILIWCMCYAHYKREKVYTV